MVSTAKYCYMTFNFRSFPHMLSIWVGVENSKKYWFLLRMVCGNHYIKFFRKPGFWQIWVFNKYRWLNANKWPQMPQKWIRTIHHGSGHALGTLNHGLGQLFCCFITFLAPGVASTPLAPPWNPCLPPDSSFVILGHSQSSWVIMSHIWPIWSE